MATNWLDLSPYGMTLMVAVIHPPVPGYPQRIMNVVGDTEPYRGALELMGFVSNPQNAAQWIHLGKLPTLADMKAAFPRATPLVVENMKQFAHVMSMPAMEPAPSPAVAVTQAAVTPAAVDGAAIPASIPAAPPASQTPVAAAATPLAASPVSTAQAAPVAPVEVAPVQSASPAQATVAPVEAATELALPVPAAAEPELRLEDLIEQASNLGINRQGQSVYEGPHGRFVADPRGRPMFEQDHPAMAAGLFLRAPDAAQLAIAAEGFVESLSQGQVQRYEDLKRFASAAFSTEMGEADSRLWLAHEAIEAAMTRSLLRKNSGKTLSDMWYSSQRLQENASYIGDLVRHVPGIHSPTPRPVTVAMQRALGTENELVGKKIVVVGSGVPFGHLSRQADLRVYTTQRQTANVRATLAAAARDPSCMSRETPDYSGADIVIANLEPGLLEKPRTFDGGLTLSRSDLAEALDGLEGRNDMGHSVILLRGGDTPEAREEYQNVRKWIGARYAVEGTFDIEGSIHTGRPESDPMHMIVVSRRRPEIIADIENQFPERASMRTEAINNYGDLWSKTTQLVFARAKIADYHAGLAAQEQEKLEGTADPELQNNSFQAPYVSMSGLGQASTMVPRNLEGATREALSRLAHKHNDVDQWIANELGKSKAQLAECLSPEQIDAVALQIDAEERGRGFLNADQTGIGKGRFLAAVMLRAALLGKKVLYITERETNISDIWRDVRHIGADTSLVPLILNNNSKVIDEQTGEVTLAAPRPDYINAVMTSGEWPAEHNMVIGTYSQFNKPGEAPQARRRRGAGARQAEQNALAARNAAIAAGGVPEGGAPAAGVEGDPNAVVVAPDAALVVVDAEEEAQLSAKATWIRNAIDEDTIVVLDESHNAASDTSNVARNIKEAIERSGGHVVYASATFAKKANNMGIYKPLFPADFDTDNLTEVVRKGGETMQETLSAMLAQDGVLLRREHDLSKCQFTVSRDEENADRNRAYMNLLAPVLAEMAYLSGDLDKRVNAQNEELARNLRRRYNGDNQQAARRLKSMQTNRVSFGSPLYNLSRLFVCSLLVDKSAGEAIDALRNGKKPVILVENTVQAVMEEMLAEQPEHTGTPDFKDMVRRVLGQMTRVSRNVRGNRRVEDLGAPNLVSDAADAMALRITANLPENILTADAPDAALIEDYRVTVHRTMLEAAEAMMAEQGVEDETVAAALDLVRGVVDNLPDLASEAADALRNLVGVLPDNAAKAVRRINALVDKLPDLPLSAIDAVRDRIEAEGRRLHEAGEIARPWTVDEITGRSLQCRDGHIIRRPTTSKTMIKNRFNSGETDCVIINTAGATGIDLHAGRRFRDQRPRVLIEQQPPADITRQIQAYGRVNRFDQVVGPEIRTLMAGLPMELRLVAMRNAKLRRLSANTTSNRESSALITGIPDLMNPVGDQVCANYGEARPDLMRLLGYDVERNMRVNEANIQAAGEAIVEEQRDTNRSANEFLARLAMLDVNRQEQTIAELEAEYKATVEELDQRGENPLKSKMIEGIVHLREKSVFEGADVDNPLSEFNRPVFAQKVFIEHAIQPLRGSQVADEIERGMIADSGAAVDLADYLERGKDSMLRNYLPMEISVADALAAGTYRLLNLQNSRTDKMINALRTLTPGKGIKMTLDGVVEDVLVSRIILPGRHYTHLASAYDVVVMAPGWGKPMSFSLKSLLDDPNYATNDGVTGDDADARLLAFDQADEGARLEARTILVGNNWQAMNLSIKHKLGSMTSWADANGVVHRGVLISKRLPDLNFLPVSIPNPAMAAALLRASPETAIFGNSELKSEGISIKKMKNDQRYMISLPLVRSKKYGAVHQHPPIQALVRRLNAAGETEAPKMPVPNADLELVLGHIMDAGVRLYTSPTQRNAANRWMAENMVRQDDVVIQDQPNMHVAA